MTASWTPMLQRDDGVSCQALLSHDGLYRYALKRIWDPSLPILIVIMLNPSKADGWSDDPTIRRITGFARAWGYGGYIVLNLFALRATDPRELFKAAEPCGLDNASVMIQLIDGGTLNPTRHRILVGWGATKRPGNGVLDGVGVRDLLRRHEVVCLGTTKSGEPRHPLYVRADQEPVEFEI